MSEDYEIVGWVNLGDPPPSDCCHWFVRWLTDGSREIVGSFVEDCEVCIVNFPRFADGTW